MADTTGRFTELDFDALRDSLRDFLRSQEEFKDYDFEGSGLSVLINILAYNSHFNAMYQNLALSEAFLDTAQKRESVASIAKQLGYVPASVRAATAYVDVILSPNRTEPSQFPESTPGGYIPTGTLFTANLNRKTYQFVTTKPHKVVRNPNTGKWEALNIPIKQGSVQRYSYVVNATDPDQRFIIPTNRADLNTLVVRVQRSETDTTGVTSPWLWAEDATTLDSDSRVFFVQQAEDGKYEVYFGDGIAGRDVQHGNVIILQFLTTDGASANGVGKGDAPRSRVFQYTPDPSRVEVIVRAAATGGGEAETLDSIRYYAPRNYQAQGRAVTAQDYQTLIANNFGDVESVYVWGGEENVPPAYGKVFIAIKPRDGVNISLSERLAIAKNIIKDKNIVGITPEVVEPDYVYVKVITSVTYDSQKTSSSPDGISQQVENAIIAWGDNRLEKFDRSLRYSELVREIDDTNPAILGSSTRLVLQKRFNPNPSVSSAYELRFENPIYHPEDGFKPVVSSTVFTFFDRSTRSEVSARIDDDGYGKLRIYKLVNGERIYIEEDAGSVDYTNGTLTLVGFQPRTGEEIRIDVQPENQDVETKRNLILLIDRNDPEAVMVSSRVKTINTNGDATGTPYPF